MTDLARAALWPFGDLLIPPSDPEDEEEQEAEWEEDEPAVTPHRTAAGPAATDEPALSLALGRRRATAALVQSQGERRLWRSADGVVVATDGARVVATARLPETLTATRFDGADPLADPLALLARGGEARARRVVDLARGRGGPAGMRFGLALECRLSAAPADKDTVLVEERCRRAGDASFTNRFWADAGSGMIFHSEQWIGDRVPMLSLRVLAPAP